MALNIEMLNGGADFDLGHQLATEIWLKTIYQQDWKLSTHKNIVMKNDVQ